MGGEIGIGGGSCSHDDPTGDAQFIHYIVPPTLQLQTLEIPPSFVKEHGRDLSKYACLEVSNGSLWKVQLKRVDGGVWLGKGLKAFLEKCDIKCGQTLLFRCEGGSIFKVFVFDATGSEIKYLESSGLTNPMVGIDQPQGVEFKQEETDDETAAEVLNEWPQNSPRGDDEVLRGKRSAPSSAKDIVLQRARAFQSLHPHFVVSMRSVYLNHHVNIPSRFKSYFLGRGLVEEVCLNGPDGRAWLMKCNTGTPPYSQARIQSGWRRFVQEYELQEEDSCIFELIDQTILVFNITIFRATEEMRDIPCPIQMTGRTKLESASVQRARRMQCSESSFKLFFRHYNSSTAPSVPISHAAAYLLDQHGNEVLLHLLGKTWSVTCYMSGRTPNPQTRFSKGWTGFAKDNDLQDGDSGVFHLVSQAPLRYNVTIHRAADP